MQRPRAEDVIQAELFAHGVAAHGLAVSNPASGAVIATVRSWSAAEVEALVPVVDMAGRAWTARTAKDRAVILRRWFDLMLAHKDALAAICTAECGKPLAESAGEVVYAAGFIEWYAEEGKRIY
ncbi:MAG: aldehyde dehydrogenase family protein, partial [Alphaproteobacteria bacterium]|nr:aldehyde dehydrogenase family protein [Alphaproteobacteria bacterium]